MSPQLYTLLNQCTVRLSVPGEEQGTGFFVAPGLVLTCAHVVMAAQSSTKSVEVYWNGQPYSGQIVNFLPVPDLALLQVELVGHPCVYLREEAIPFDDMYSYGYPEGHSGGDPATFSLEGEAGKYGEQFKFKDGQVRPGMSGAPVLNVRTGYICGIVQLTRDRSTALGGRAIPITTVFQAIPDIVSQQQRFHSHDRLWGFARLCKSPMLDPESATRDYLHLVSEFAAQRPVVVPAGRGIADVSQIPSVVAVRGSGVAATSMWSESDQGNSSAHSGPGSADGVFRWIPLQVRWSTVVLSGAPGSGKSCLLNLHADTHARDGLSQLEKLGGDPLSVPIPVLVDCSAFGYVLPDVPERETVINALIDAIRKQVAVALSHTRAHEGIDAVVELAYGDGRLVICLDALDEADGRERQRVLQALRYLTERGNRLVVTSRPHPRLREDTMRLGACFRAEVVGFSLGQVYSFARAWFADAPGLAMKFEAGMRRRPELQVLAQVPLLAAFLCRLVSDGRDVSVLPAEPAQLYSEFVHAALSGQWLDLSRQTHVLPDPDLRLRVLINAIGRLTKSWRARVDRFSEFDLDAAFDAVFTEHPEYKRAAEAAKERRKAWWSLQPHDGPLPGHSSSICWEYQYDGLFAYDTVSGSRPTLRFIHPVLGEYCIAAYVAQLSLEQLELVVHEHQWFDSSWEQIWSLSAALMREPDQLVKLFMETKPDAWWEQTFLAAQCVVGAAGRVAGDLQERVVTAVGVGVSAPRLFDSDRALAQLQRLVRADVVGSMAIARTIMTDPRHTSRTRLRVVAMLAERKDAAGLVQARAVLTDSAVPITYRSWLARAVVIAEDAEGLEALKTAIKGAQADKLQRLLAAIPVEVTCGGNLVSDMLRDSGLPLAIRAAAGRVLIRLGDTRRTELAKEVATDSVTVWMLRAALISELLAEGEDDVVADGITVVRDPNVSNDSKIELLEKLIWRAQTDVIPLATTMLQRRDIDWQQRKRLARAVAELGPIGVRELRSLIESALPMDLKIRPLVALIEVGEATEIATRIVCDSGALTWIRTRLACALLEIGDRSVADEILMDLAAAAESSDDFQFELIATMTRQSIPGTESAALQLLRRRAVAAEAGYTGYRQLIDALGGSGPTGVSLLSAIAEAPKLAEEDRVWAIVGLAEKEPARAGRLFTRFLDQFTTFVRSRLVILLAEKGLAEVADELKALLPVDPEAHTALYKLLNSSRSERQLVNRLLSFGDAVDRVIPVPVSTQMLGEGEEFLVSCGLSWASEAEYRALREWVYDRLEQMVGAKIAAFLTVNQLDEFEELIGHDEESREFLNSRVSGYPQLVQERMVALQHKIREHPPHLRPVEEIPTMRRLARRAEVIGQWLDETHAGGEVACAAFLEKNRHVIVSQESLALLSLASEVSSQTYDYAALHYIVTMALNEGISKASDFVQNANLRHTVYCDLLADSKGQFLTIAGLAGTLLTPNSPEPYFYAALGLTMIGAVNDGIELMSRSSKKADLGQRQDGCNTIRREGERFGWDPALVQTLVDSLDPPQNDA